MKTEIDIFDYAAIIGAEMDFTFYYNQNKRFSCFLKQNDRLASVLENGMSVGQYGNSKGFDLDGCILDYVDKIKGKTITFSGSKTEYKVPNNLTYTGKHD